MKAKTVALVAVVTMMAAASWAQDTSALHPPKGSRIALIVFEDLECPACANAEPLLLQAERNYGVALVRHDFVLPTIHHWSMEAHIMARYFDTQSPQMGEGFRHYIFTNQKWIYNSATLKVWADKFGTEEHSPLPSIYVSALRDKVNADIELGKTLGVDKTPTIYVVTNSPKVPFEVVTDTHTLFAAIDKVNDELKNVATAPAAVKKK